ncbi:DNA repair protein RadA/Sms [Keratinibaculum paraultunense]|uniref:DNA repair protein RadA n=1 Tax=Keratinibaculum paraultunense TaxID=1278232 RepID=A0A4R3KSM8_9FIRM|nr:DNA repair protein RadA [Keratinibaculum paraultunense]QQY79445.1 DNA repair protein RadA [Keratinibaculum paraultunense]TCS88062.1 DNA repair protein RadA/Sms [Keratinibaculum paraultunense]
MKKKTIFKCTNCGYESIRWMGRCSECNSWNSFEEIEIDTKEKKTKGKHLEKRKVTPVKLYSIDVDTNKRIRTSMEEFNRVLGGGIVKDSVTILTARPGAGKSTLLLEISNDVANKGYNVLYASGEESETQISDRANRILKQIPEGIWILSDTSMNSVLDAIEKTDPDLIIIDSIQTFSLEEFDSRAGSPIQTIECANVLVDVAKNQNRPRAVIMVGHMTKANEMAGLRTLEHLVDTVLYLEGESDEELRTLMATKNRFGRTGEIGLFSMTEEGMLPIDNPSEYFITKREQGKLVPGSALSVIKEGSRLIIVEVESLVSHSFTPYPSRVGECLRRDQLSTLISILEQRGNMVLYDKNVVIKTTGGLKLREQSVNLAVIMSIASSVINKGIPCDVVFIAEVGLTGELKKVPSMEARIRELDRMGFRKVYIPKNSLRKNVQFENIKVVELNTLQEVINHVFYNKY